MIKKILLLSILLLLLSITISFALEENKIYVLKLGYDRGEVSLKSIYISVGNATSRIMQPEVSYRAKVVSLANQILYDFKFDIPLTIYYDVFKPTGISGGSIKLNETNFTLILPYFKNATKINIYDKNDTQLLSVDVLRYSKVCGNGFCEPEEGENSTNCFRDCPSERKIEQISYIILIVMAVAGLTAFIIYRKIKEGKWKKLYAKYRLR